MAEVEDGDGGKRKVGNKIDFFLKKIKNYGSQLDSDMWQERRERSCKIFFYSFNQLPVDWGPKREDTTQSWVYS